MNDGIRQELEALDATRADADRLIDESRAAVQRGLELQERNVDAIERATHALERIADNVESLSENTALVAIGMAKIVERCFCGHRLDEHFEANGDPTGCTASGCNCDRFLPLHLAVTRILNSLGHDVQSLSKRLAALLPEPETPGGIVSPFKTH